MNKEKKELIKDFEIQILSFFLRDKIYLKKEFSYRKKEDILKMFSSEDITYIVGIVLSYYQKYQNLLIETEFQTIMDNSVESGKIDAGQYERYIKIYKKAKSYTEELKEEQFERIYDEWLNIEITKKIEDSIKRNINLLESSNKGVEFVTKLSDDFHKAMSSKKEVKVTKFNLLEEDIIKEQIRWLNEEEEDVNVKTGYPSIDEDFNGFGSGTLSFLGGLASSGKSLFALNIAHNAYWHQKKNVLILSLEMPIKQYVNRLNSREAKVEYRKLLKPIKNNLTDKEKKRVEKAIKERGEKEKHGDIRILDIPTSEMTWSQIVNYIEEEMPEFEPHLIIVDYFSLISLPDARERRDILLGNLAKEMRGYAKQANIAILALVQANRAAKTKDKKTNKYNVDIEIENIEDSNKLGQDCDNFLAVKMEKTDDDLSKDMIVSIVKQRDGIKDKSFTLKTKLACSYIYEDDEETLMKEGYNSFGTEEELYSELSESDIKEDMSEDSFIEECKKMGIYLPSKDSSLEDLGIKKDNISSKKELDKDSNKNTSQSNEDFINDLLSGIDDSQNDTINKKEEEDKISIPKLEKNFSLEETGFDSYEE